MISSGSSRHQSAVDVCFSVRVSLMNLPTLVTSLNAFLYVPLVTLGGPLGRKSPESDLTTPVLRTRLRL
jgi:hypothetical protein